MDFSCLDPVHTGPVWKPDMDPKQKRLPTVYKKLLYENKPCFTSAPVLDRIHASPRVHSSPV